MSSGSRNTRLITARPSRPRFGFPWPAALLGLATVLFAGAGVVAVSAEPESVITIVVEDGLPLNITQQTVDAALDGPIRSWEPLTFRVTADLLSYAQLHGQEDAGADVVLSTALDNDTESRTDARFSGAAVRSPHPDREQASKDRYAISNGYIKNLGLGHGPLAVAAAAQTASDVLTSGPIRTPVFWIAGTGLGVLLTGAALTGSLRLRRRREERYRRLVTAQRKLARVVLDLEALEVTYATTPDKSRPKAYRAAWDGLSGGTLALARREEEVIEAVFDRRTSLSPATGKLVDRFEAGARELTRLSDALLGAGSVHGGLAGGGSTFERLAAPLNDAAGELLIRLADAPEGTLPEPVSGRLRAALADLLAITARKPGSAGSGAAVQAWTKAERELETAARMVARALRRYPMGRVLPRARTVEDQSKLRAGLGLRGDGSGGALAALDEANAVARALFGPIGAYDRQPVAAPPPPPRKRIARPGGKPGRLALKLWIWGGITAFVASMICAGFITVRVMDSPGWRLSGEEHLRSLSIDGRTEGISESEIRRYLVDRFPGPLDVTLAIRDAEEYLEFEDGDPLNPRAELVPAGTLEAIWRIKGEFPRLLDPLTRELLPEKAIMPVMVFDDGAVAVPTTLTGAVAVGDANQLGDWLWNAGSVYVAETLPNVHLSNELEDLARGLQSNGFREQEVNGALLFWLLTTVMTLGLLTTARIIQYGGSISAGLGRFGRGGAALRRAKARLDELALGLDDSRLNAVAVLGAGPAGSGAEAGQRLFERALVMGWREAQDLASLPLASRLDAHYAYRVAHLERLVATLGERDADVDRRSRALLEATRGAGGGQPAAGRPRTGAQDPSS